ncbi:MAG: stage 0 sporulation protein, partial [Clostridia bacterium]|nr:stage 0 sporulation protein [Clostridia bacterium]
EKIEKHKLNMKLIDCEFTFDNTKVIFYFTSETRVDFRELVKDLASHFRIRIELRQVGIRDEAKLLGGLGPCGRACCCSSCLGDFARVSIKMAKTQGLSLNPGKISGLCGRLMCCLQYENDYYSETYKLMPKINSEIKTPDGKAIVLSNDMLKKIVTAKITSHDGSVEIKQYPLDKIKAKHTLSVDDHDDIGDDLKGILD